MESRYSDLLKKDLIDAGFFFIDLVGLSNPKTTVNTQKKKIKVLNDCISETAVFKNNKDSILVLPTGDGMCLAFLEGGELALKLAIELHQKLGEYNRAKLGNEIIQVRIGLNSGFCYLVKNIQGEITPWGPGIILAQRVMDLGDDGHIFLTSKLAGELRQLSNYYKKIIHPVNDFEIKHGETLLVWSAYGDNFGNSSHPKKDPVEISKYTKEIIKLQKTALYPSLKVELTVLDPEKMLVQHKRTYNIENISDKPITDVLHGIATDVNKNSMEDLKIKVFDEQKKEMKISSININKPTSKEFTTEFNTPIKPGEKNREYTLIYEVEEPERYFENAFYIDVHKFSLDFTYPATNFKCNPIIYEYNQESEQKFKSKNQPIKEKDGGYVKAHFSSDTNFAGESIRIEW